MTCPSSGVSRCRLEADTCMSCGEPCCISGIDAQWLVVRQKGAALRQARAALNPGKGSLEAWMGAR